MTRTVAAGVLDVAYETYGPASGWPVVLLHGFPYDVRSYAEVGPLLAAQGAHVVVPYLRGFGPTRFLRTPMPLASISISSPGWSQRSSSRPDPPVAVPEPRTSPARRVSPCEA